MRPAPRPGRRLAAGAGRSLRVARALPVTHVLALLRYGVLDRTGAGLHDIWGMTSTTTDAALSLLVLAGWAILITAAAIRVFTRSAVN